jgi:hypothetical protein
MSGKENLGMTNVVKITSDQIGLYVKVCRKKGLVPAFFGPPGCGKTSAVASVVKQIAKEEGYEQVTFNPTIKDWFNPKSFNCSTVLTSQIEELDARGAPYVKMIDGVGHVTVFSPTELFPTEGNGVIVFDEFPNGRSEVQNALQQILLDHKAGNFNISKNISFVIAGNRPSDNCGTYNIPSALRNRVMWFEVSRPDKVEKWIDIMEDEGRPIDGRVQAFMLSAVGMKFFDDFDPKADQYAYGTLRSWEMVSKAIQDEKEDKIIRNLVSACVGVKAGIDFSAFLKMIEQIEMKELLRNPKLIHQHENNPGLMYSICVSLVEMSNNKAEHKPIYQILNEIRQDEYGLFVVSGMLRKMGHAGFINSLKTCPEGASVMTRYAKLIASMDK